MTRMNRPIQTEYESLDQLIETIAGGGFKEKIELERTGITVGAIKQMAGCLGLAPSELLAAIGSPVSLRFARPSTRVQGLPCLRCMELIRTLLLVRHLHLHNMNDTFNPDRWLGHWLMQPARPFAWLRPVDWLDTPSGAEYIRHVITAVDAGVYL